MSIFSLFEVFDLKLLNKSKNKKTIEVKNMEQLVTEIATAIKNTDKNSDHVFMTTNKGQTRKKSLGDSTQGIQQN